MASKSEENYHDFKKKSENRNFKLIVEDKVLFIDLYVMSTFKKIYSGENYKENQNKKISIADAKFDDIHQMLQCLGPRPQRPITAENAGKMLELADRFEIMGFYDEIVEFMASESCISALSVDDAIHLLMVVDKIQVNNVEVYKKLVSRLSRVTYRQLKKSGIFNAISQNLSLALMRAVSTGINNPFYGVYKSDQVKQIDDHNRRISEFSEKNFKQINGHIFSETVGPNCSVNSQLYRPLCCGGCGSASKLYVCPNCPSAYPMFCGECKIILVPDRKVRENPFDLPPCTKTNPTLIEKLQAPEPQLDLDFFH